MSSKTRKALLEASISLSWATHGHLTEEDAKKCLSVVDAALSEPLKNCEVDTTEGQVERFKKFCLYRKCSECQFHVDGDFLECGVRWAQMPYEKGATK